MHASKTGFDDEREMWNCLAILGADEKYLSNQKAPLHYGSRAVRSAEGACSIFSGAGTGAAGEVKRADSREPTLNDLPR